MEALNEKVVLTSKEVVIAEEVCAYCLKAEIM